MRHLTLGDLKLGLKDLLENRVSELKSTQSGTLYYPMLAAKRAAIEALPDAFTGDRPISEQLHDTDARHDGFGSAIWHATEAILAHPNAPEDLQSAALRIRKAFVPRLGVLRSPYAEEARAAHKNRPLLAERESDLRRFPVFGGGTLYDWVVSFLDEGDRLSKLLSDDALAETDSETATDAAAVRSSTISLLVRFREALGDEVDANPDMPRSIEATLFGYLDELDQRRIHPAVPTPAPADPA